MNRKLYIVTVDYYAFRIKKFVNLRFYVQTEKKKFRLKKGSEAFICVPFESHYLPILTYRKRPINV